jgi:predicted protein tyrosine phosphatase
MNFDIKIAGIYEAGLLVDQGWPTKVISLVDPGTPIPWKQPDHLIVRMHDITSRQNSRSVIPDWNHLDTVMNFTKNIDSGEHLLVHCHQGISRSTAMAIAVCIQHGMSPEAAYKYVKQRRDFMMPNMLLINLIDSYWDCDGALVDIARADRESMKNTASKNSDIASILRLWDDD